jgi:DNA (cytosine-5)-methyltransferase 1
MLPLDGFRQPADSAVSYTDHLRNHLSNVNADGSLSYIDLFAGCGGLSLGLEKAGFRLVLAVEKSPMAAETFYHNFIKRLTQATEWGEYCAQPLDAQAAQGLVVDEVGAVLERRDILEALRSQDIDLLAGGPPCQGFSMAGRRNPEDVRNQLPWQFLEFVEAIEPKAVIIENVVGIGQDFVKHGADAPFAQLRLALEGTGRGYVAQPMRVNAMHFGVPQHRPRMLIVALRSDLAARHGLSTGLALWRSDEKSERPLLAPKPTRDTPLTVADALWDLGEAGYVSPCGSGRYMELFGAYAREMRCDPSWLPPALPEALPPSRPPNHTLRKHTPEITLRFELYQYLQSQKVRPGIFNIPMDAWLSRTEQEDAVRRELASAGFPAKSPGGRILAQDLDELAWLIMHKGTKKHSQRPLRPDQPSPTVMSLPDDFVHPWSPRTLTVREMARIQSFPDSFEFRSKETTGSHRRRFEVPQYTQVGNAVPPKLARAVGARLGELLAGGHRKNGVSFAPCQSSASCTTIAATS